MTAAAAIIARHPRRALLAAALLALFAAALATLPPLPADAQTTPPAVYYGRGLRPGGTIEALVRGAVCASSPIDQRGEWALSFTPAAPCAPRDGDTTSFRIDGALAPQTAPFRAGFTPPDVANGLALSGGAPASSPTPGAPAGGGTGPGMLSGAVPRAGGLGLVVFGGGTAAQLVQASGCPAATAAFWATASSGEFVIYLPAATVAELNARWHALFPAGLPANQPLLAKCA